MWEGVKGEGWLCSELYRRVVVLSQANIRALMGSEVAITELMTSLDQAVQEIGDMETKLDVYDQLLSGVRDMMGKMGSQYAAILMENRNLSALLKEVEELVVSCSVVRVSVRGTSLSVTPICRPSWTLTPLWSTRCCRLRCQEPATSATVLWQPQPCRVQPSRSCPRECPSCRWGGGEGGGQD